jgi:hypothetical protein
MSEQLSPLATLMLIDIQQGFDDPYWGRRTSGGMAAIRATRCSRPAPLP